MGILLVRLAFFLVALPAAAAQSPCREKIAFLGFSDNEQGFAETVHVVCHPKKNVTDQFTVARVFASATGERKGLFFTSAPERSTEGGETVSLSTATMAANYPRYRSALRQAAWNKVLHAAHFRHVRHKFEDDVIRLRANDDSVQNVHVEQGIVTVRAYPQKPLSFVITVRTKDGEHFDIAAVHGAAGEQVRLESFFAPSGRTVIARVVRANGTSEWLTRGTKLPGPIDSPNIGALNVMKWTSESALKDYGSVGDGKHSDEVDDYIEDAFRL